MKRKASFSSVAIALSRLTDEEMVAISDNPTRLKEFASALVKDHEENSYVSVVEDMFIPESLQAVASKWHNLANDLGYRGPVLWQVRAGFTLRRHAPKVGPCYKDFIGLQDSGLTEDEPTEDGYVFWVPRLIGTTLKEVEPQCSLLVEMRKRYGLPERYLTGFGSAALIAGLIFEHFKLTGERVPLEKKYVRTDTFVSGGLRLGLGDFDCTGLGCGWGFDANAADIVGVFPLGIEVLV